MQSLGGCRGILGASSPHSKRLPTQSRAPGRVQGRRPTNSLPWPRLALHPPWWERVSSSPAPALRGCLFGRSWFIGLLFHAEVDDFAGSSSVGRGGVGGWLGAVCSEKPTRAVWFRAMPLPRTGLMGPAPCPTSLQLQGSAGVPAPGEAGLPGFLKQWVRLPGLDSSAFYRHPQGSAKNGRKRGGPASAQLWLLLFSPGGSWPQAGLSGGPSAAQRRLRRGSAVSFQHDVMFPGLGKKGLQLPACVGLREHRVLGLGGCRLYPFLNVSCSSSESQVPGTMTGACWDMMAAGAHPECLLTSGPSAPGPWGPSGAAEPDQAVPGSALLRWSWAVVCPGQWLSLAVHRDAQRCRPMALQPLPGFVAALLPGKALSAFLVWSSWNEFLGDACERGQAALGPGRPQEAEMGMSPLYEP